MSAVRRCGVTGPDAAGVPNALGCCRNVSHDGDAGGGDHCAHRCETLTGTPGRIVASRSLFGLSFADCDGRANPVADWIVHSIRQGAVVSRFELIPPEEENTP